jgi:hypothetical protein
VDSDVEEVNIAALADAIDYKSGSDVSDPVVPFSLPTWHWSSLIWSSDNLPSVSADCLLDGGSQLVLVSKGFVAHSGLPLVPLPKPISITVVLPKIPDSESLLKNKKKLIYCSGVSLTVSSVNNRWSSCSCTAVVLPRLIDDCHVILGLPWLTSNHIVMDFEKCTACVKGTGFDLMSPNFNTCPRTWKRKPMSRNSLRDLKRNFRNMLQELEATLWRRNLVLRPRPTDGGGFSQIYKPELLLLLPLALSISTNN